KPVALEKLGMTAALKDLVNKYRVKGILDISINTNNVDGLLSKDSKLHVYRIIQELLNNALKHAQASEIDVLVNRADDGLVIMVQDNGQGFDPNTIKKGLGLDNLQSRVNVLRGEMEVDTSISRGTAVTVHIPLSIQNLMAPVLQIVD
ncbi:MAG: signal transduction histidine kinase, partial [Saprospiraceae bacterium]